MTQHDGGPAFPRHSTQYIPQPPLTTASVGYWGGTGGPTWHDPGHAGMSIARVDGEITGLRSAEETISGLRTMLAAAGS